VTPEIQVAECGSVRIGCSGWQYAEWRNPVYGGAPRDAWFGRYATWFDTVELNSTFYRLPSESTVARWAATAPPEFVFAVKLGAFGTHRKKLREPEVWLPRHVERFAPLGAALGPTLIQLPPHWHRDIERLDALLAVAPPTMRWALEVRDPTWLHDDVFAVLARHDAALCIHDLLPDHPWIRTASWTYLRFHGPHARRDPYRGRYTGRRLGSVARRLEPWMVDGTDVYAYFNNDIDAAAVSDARWLRARLSGSAGIPRT
jgi:uncharacterized protein YecE (DUF72 family)